MKRVTIMLMFIFLISSRFVSAQPRPDKLSAEQLVTFLYDEDRRKATEAYRRIQNLLADFDDNVSSEASEAYAKYRSARAAWLSEFVAKESAVGTVNISIPPNATNPREFSYIRLGSIERISMRGAGIRDDHLKFLSGMPALEWLDISDAKISGELFDDLNFPTLKMLRLSNCKVSDETLAAEAFHQFRGLKSLEISNCPITNKSVKHLPTQLEELRLQGTSVNASGIQETLKRLPKLRTLVISSNQSDQRLFDAMSEFTNLKTIAVERINGESDKDFRTRYRLPTTLQVETFLGEDR